MDRLKTKLNRFNQPPNLQKLDVATLPQVQVYLSAPARMVEHDEYSEEWKLQSPFAGFGKKRILDIVYIWCER